MAVRTSISDGASRREYAEAVRRFEILARALRPCGRSDVAAAVVQQGGAEVAHALAKAFARAPCYVCKDGRMTCDICGGRPTFTANGRFCETCNGAGHSPCLFCGGTGFLPTQSIPRSIVAPAARMRLEWAARLLQQVVRNVSRLTRDGTPPSPLRDWIGLFHITERIQAVLEETRPILTISEGAEPQQARSAMLAEKCQPLADRCRRLLAAGILRICRARAQAEEAGSHRRILWERQADHYEPLARRPSG